jgi:hypothetical protein
MNAGRLVIYNCLVFLSINGDLDVPFLYPEDRDSLVAKVKIGAITNKFKPLRYWPFKPSHALKEQRRKMTVVIKPKRKRPWIKLLIVKGISSRVDVTETHNVDFTIKSGSSVLHSCCIFKVFSPANFCFRGR